MFKNKLLKFAAVMSILLSSAVFFNFAEQAKAQQADALKIYPNPVRNGKLKFEVNAAEASKVEVKVFTLNSELVWNNVYNDAPGKNVHEWNLMANNGSKTASDVYICRLRVSSPGSDSTLVKRVLIIK